MGMSFGIGIFPLRLADDVDVDDEVQALKVARRIRDDVKAAVNDAIEVGTVTDEADNLATQTVMPAVQACEVLYARLIMSVSEEARAHVPKADRTDAEKLIRRDPLLLLTAATEGWSPVQLSPNQMKALRVVAEAEERARGGAAFAERAEAESTHWN